MKKYFTVFLFLSSISMLTAQDLVPSQWPNLTGYWKFQDASNLTKATIGNDLTLTGTQQRVPGPSLNDTAVRLAVGSYFKCTHNISPNGGGDSVNEYTLMFDFKILSLKQWHTFFQTDTTNKNDGECFIRPTNSATPGAIGVGATGYSSARVDPGKWYRLMISVKLGHFYRYYLNGDLIHEGDTQEIDDRFALNPYFLLFADDNQEDDTIDIASVAVFDTCLSSSDISKIGTIDPCVLHPMTLNLGNDTTICGSNILSKTLGPGNYSYKWSTGETTSSVTFSMAKHGSGSKTISVKQTDVNGCNLSDTFVLGIYNAPVVNLGRDTAFCEGPKLKLTAGSASGNAFEWHNLPATSIISKLNTITVDSSGYYEVKMSNQFGCTDLDTIEVTVRANPVKPSVFATSKSFCLRDSAYINGLTGYSKYKWNSGQDTRGMFVNIGGTYRLMVTDNFGCISPWSDSLNIMVNPLPATPVLKYTPDTIICQNDSVLLSTINGYASYDWNDGPNKSSRIIKRNGIFNVSVTDINGCKSAASNTVLITVNPSPGKPEIEASGPINACMGDSVVLKSIQADYYYQWNTSQTTRSITIKSGGSFRVRVRNGFNCLSPWSDTMKVVFNIVSPKPVIFALGKDSLTCNTFTDRYQWVANGIITDTVQSIKGKDKTWYSVRINLRSGACWSPLSDSFYFEEDKTGISLLKENNSLMRIVPNPGKDVFHLQIDNLVDQITGIRIVDISGRKVWESGKDRMPVNNGLLLDLSHLPEGVYFVIADTPAVVYRAKLILQ